MQKISLLAAAGLLCLSGTACAQGVQSQRADSQKTVSLKAVSVVSTRATAQSPVAFTNVEKAELEKINHGVDIPFLLNMTPSLVVSSDAGMGMGYTSLRIRGVDASRINITANGIPLNDPEDQGFYWVDVPDLASSLRSIQVQRGAGTSTNGVAAFGASINMQTEGLPATPHAEFRGSYGSYNTEKETFSIGTGALGGHFVLEARLSNMGTDGFLQRASAKMNSYMVQGGYYNDNTFLKLILFGGQEKTYHAWDYSWKPGMNRRYNSCGYMFTDDQGIDHYYDNQTDHYLQTNFQALFHHDFNRRWTLNAALHNTGGEGYYEQYKRKQYLVEYGMQGFGTRSDLVRQKKLKNTLTGFVFSLDYKQGPHKATLGGGMNRFDGDHFGKVIWVKSMDGTGSSIQREPVETAVPSWEYYRNRGFKIDGNIYLRASENLSHGLRAFADLQYRHVHYTIRGTDDTYNYAADAMRQLQVRKNFNFLNPKLGLNWNFRPHHRAYISASIAHREPPRNNYTNTVDLNGHPLPELNPKAEKFLDYELGYQYQQSDWSLGANLYYMDYKDQLVQNGLLNDIGEAVFVNVPKSYRTGIELQAAARPLRWLSWECNATLSRNRIRHYTQQDAIMDDDWNVLDMRETYYKSATLAFAPAFVLNNGLNFHWKGWEALLHTHYVSRQYLTNTHEKGLSIPAYFVNNLHLSYSFKMKGTKGISVGATIYNLLNEEYETNGWGSRAFFQDRNIATYAPDYGLSTQAGIHVMGHVSIAF